MRLTEQLEQREYYLDNCGGDEYHSGRWYCAHCDQEECEKREAKWYEKVEW